jgi:enoyl-CoA hydratase/carnithine racemase
MSSKQLVLVDSPANGVFVLTLNSPKVNALSTAMLDRIHYLATDPTLLGAHAVIITGGDRLFAAGAEISEFGGPDEAATIGAAFHRALNAVAALLWRVTIALHLQRPSLVSPKSCWASFLAVVEHNGCLDLLAQVVQKSS